MAFRNLPEMPCGPILELHGQRKRFHVPYGLKKLLEDMTREVIRTQPENIYDFLANFMVARGQRKKAEEDKKKVPQDKRKSWQEPRGSQGKSSVLSPEELKEFLDHLGPSKAEAEKHAVVIQSAFRGHQARLKVKQLKENIDPTIKRKSIEASTEKYNNAKTSITVTKPRKSLVETLTPETATGGEQDAALKIQSAFRGHLARKMVQEKKAEIYRKTMMVQAQKESIAESVAEEIPREEEQNHVSQDSGPVEEEEEMEYVEHSEQAPKEDESAYEMEETDEEFHYAEDMEEATEEEQMTETDDQAEA